MDKGEVILTGSYMDFSIGRHFHVGSASNADIAGALVQLSNEIEPWIYRFAGIDMAKLDALVSGVGKGLPAAIAFMRTLKRDMLLSAAQNKNTMLPIAENYLLNRLFKQADVGFKPPAATILQPGKEELEGQIMFVGNCKGWFAVKKLTVDAKTQAWEVAGILAGINHTMVNKAFDFIGMEGTVQQGRKGWNNLADALSQLDGTNSYVVCKTCEGFGIKPYASPEMMVNEYPDIKPPKVKGRKPKG